MYVYYYADSGCSYVVTASIPIWTPLSINFVNYFVFSNEGMLPSRKLVCKHNMQDFKNYKAFGKKFIIFLRGDKWMNLV